MDRETKLRRAVHALIESRWRGNTSSAARALKLKQPHLYRYLSGDNKAGLRLIEAVAPFIPGAVATFLRMPGSTRSAVSLPNLDEAAELVSARYGPQVLQLADTLRRHFVADEPFEFWVGVLNAYARSAAAAAASADGAKRGA